MLIWSGISLLDSPSAIKEASVHFIIQKATSRRSYLSSTLVETGYLYPKVPRIRIFTGAALSSDRLQILHLRKTPTVMLYTHDVLHDGSPLKKRSCDIILIDAMWPVTIVIKDVASFPFQHLLFQPHEGVSNYTFSRRT